MYKAIVFDLYGTLVPNFSKSSYEPVYREMASILCVDYEQFRSAFGHAHRDRCRGRWETIEQGVAEAVHAINGMATTEQVHRASAVRTAFTRSSIQASDTTLGVLRELRAMGCGIGLLSNCGPDVPAVWHKSNMHSLIDSPVFSSEIRVLKPNLKAYAAVASRLQVSCKQCFFVGDGSSREIEGANEAGLRGILVPVSLEDVYDPEGRSTSGDGHECIGSLHELIPLLTQPIVQPDSKNGTG